ncbi:MAG: ArsR family transcriptional regulator, partial [Candidatus Poseidoniaceae archaeon]|nr:ArsR family transcriptional regulator [Candidatus Poseidoniaceae archaeon]
ETIDYERLTATNCAQSLPLDMSTSLSGIDNGFDLNITVVPQVSEVDLRWIGPCSVTVSIIDLEISDEVHRQASLCNEHDGRHLSLPYSPGNALVLEVGEVSMIDFNNAPLPDGMYQMIVTLEANPTTSAGFVFEWPIVETVEVQSMIIEEEPEQEESRLVSGTWSGILTEEGTCWILDSPQDGQLLLSLAALGSWAPQQGWSGTYQSLSATSSPQCSKFQAPSIELLTVEAESGPTVEQAAEEQSDGPTLVLSEESEAPLATTLIVVVTTTSLLSLLVSLVLGNESLRIPSTAAGLWFLGMIGRTHETTDGRYQRGRLMGYLTANPGCHFRALMAALDMSNGQITHHLRILESEEAIWRRKDGRLVRYYPLTNTMNPGMSDEELPVPPLSPDPNSLQGKILTLLDADGPMGEFPTQAELAKRLEKSQQLVSHHLRTLQKFGLVEKRKMGIKNRYKLTREAIFLLESNDDFIRD